MLVASAIQGLAVKTPLKAQGFGSDKSLTRCRGRTGKKCNVKIILLCKLHPAAAPRKGLLYQAALGSQYIHGSLLLLF